MKQHIDLSSIPANIVTEIRKEAKDAWPGDREMQAFCINEETNGYLKLQAFEYGPAEPVKDAILVQAMEFSGSWEERASFVEEEVAAYTQIQTLPPDDIPADIFAGFMQAAAAENDWYNLQLDEIKRAIDGYRYVQRTREKIGPIRELLVQMEQIVGQECYNGNIQNYSSWGEWDGEGRSFRYPITFIRNGEEDKRKARTADLEHEELVTGYYKFGANELSIYRALVKIVDMLEAEYGFVATKPMK